MSNLHLSPSFKRILLEAVVLCALAVTVGLSLNYRMVMNAFTGKMVVPPRPALSGNGARETGRRESAAPGTFLRPARRR